MHRMRASKKASSWVHKLLPRYSSSRIKACLVGSLVEYRYVLVSETFLSWLTFFLSTMIWVQVAFTRLVWLSEGFLVQDIGNEFGVWRIFLALYIRGQA
jgi:hypothetical protein